MVSNGPTAIDSGDNEVELLDPTGTVLANIVGTKESVAEQLVRQITLRLVDSDRQHSDED